MNKAAFAATIFGFILGTSAMFLVQGKVIDQLRHENSRMAQENLDLTSENQLLAAKLNQSVPKEVIDKIVVDVEQPPPGLSPLDVTRFVKNQLEFLVGSELSVLRRQPDLPRRLVEGRTIVVDQIEYVIHVNYVVVMEQLHISVTPAPKNHS
jgi:hypothetical protein